MGKEEWEVSEDDISDLEAGFVLKYKKGVYLIQNAKNKWGHSKGHLKKGETYFQGALRELYEEVGLDLSHINENDLE